MADLFDPPPPAPAAPRYAPAEERDRLGTALDAAFDAARRDDTDAAWADFFSAQRAYFRANGYSVAS